MAFQFAVCRSLDVRTNFIATETPSRSAHARGIPDGLLASIRINVMGQTTFRLVGAFLEVVGPEISDFLEVKAQQRSITLSTGQGQIRGFIQALARQRPRRVGLGMPESPRPALLLVTTADTQVSQEVADEAAINGVAIYHAEAWENAGLLTVGTFRQRTSFADVLPSFTLPSLPEPLSLQRR